MTSHNDKFIATDNIMTIDALIAKQVFFVILTTVYWV